MKPPALSFTEVNIREMPGFETGGFAIEELVPGLNIIYGPNASGKSSLSRAMRLLLRPSDKRGEECSIVGKLLVDGETILIDYKPGKVFTERGGKEIPTQSLAPAAMDDRYILALADLLGDDDEAGELTKKILKEASGGYELSEAGTAAGFRSTARKGGGHQKTYDDANTKWSQAQEEAERLAKEEGELPDLDRRLSEVEEADGKLRLLDKAEKYHTAREREADSAKALNEFPAGMETLQSDAQGRLDNIESAIQTAEKEKTVTEGACARAQETLDQSPLQPTHGIKPELVSALGRKVTKLESLERKKTEAATTVKVASAGSDKALLPPGSDCDTVAAKVERLDLARVEKLLTFARHAESHQRDLRAYNKVKDWLQTDQQREDVNSLRDGVKALNSWLLRTEASGPPPRLQRDSQSPLFLLSLGVALVFLMAGIFGDARWFIAIFLPLLQAGYLFWRARKKPDLTDTSHDPTRSITEYRKTGLEPPGEWELETVQQLLRHLESRYDQARLDEEKRQRWAGEKNQGAELEKRAESLALERKQWHEDLGLDWSHDDLNVFLCVEQLRSLLESQHDLAKAKATEEVAVADFDSLLGDIAATIEEYGLTPPGDCELACSTVQRLGELHQEYVAAQGELARSRTDIKKAEDQIKRRKEERADVFELAGLTVGQEAELQGRLARIEDYKRKKKEHQEQRALLNSAKEDLRENPELLELAKEGVLNERIRLEAIAAKKAELTERRIGTQTRIDQAKEKQDIAEKIDRRDQAKDDLALRRDEDREAVIGNELLGFVRTRHRQIDQTSVFSRAQKLFAKFTRGRFQLTIDDDIETPAFRCIDTATGRGRSIEQLSSGTRIQLLLAVRISFVENQEQGGKKIPFILDEALAISDELRAEEIIKAGIDICSEGRQFFYLTAQHDEVGKWRRLLDTTELKSTSIDLAEVRDFSQKERVPPQIFEPPAPVAIPLPSAMSHDDYGELLGVPSIDQFAKVGAVHLWYFIDDPKELWQLLEHGINLWGQLEHLVESDNSENIDAGSALYCKAAAAARTLESALKYRLVGRGRPLNRQVIKESDACGKFLETVVEKAEELAGDGERLIEALNAGIIKGFRKQKILVLEAHLQNNDFIDPRQVLSPDEIASSVLAAVYKDIEANLLSNNRVRWLVQQVLRDDN